MKIPLLTAAIVCAALAFGAGAARAEECGAPITADDALKAEDARYAAQTAGDFAAMDKMFGDDLIYTHSSARTDSKASFIDIQRSKGIVYRTMQRSDVVVRTYGCVAIIAGIGHFGVTVAGKDDVVDLRFQSVWVRRGQALQFVSWESTSLPKR